MSVMLLAASGCRKDKKEAEQYVPVIDVATVRVDSVVVHSEYPGYLTAMREVDLVARVDGTLTSKPSNAGEIVREGTVLYTIEPTQYLSLIHI